MAAPIVNLEGNGSYEQIAALRSPLMHKDSAATVAFMSYMRGSVCSRLRPENPSLIMSFTPGFTALARCTWFAAKAFTTRWAAIPHATESQHLLQDVKEHASHLLPVLNIRCGLTLDVGTLRTNEVRLFPTGNKPKAAASSKVCAESVSNPANSTGWST
jgi:hypothetical protein